MPAMLAALPRCVAIPIDWNRKLVERFSPVASAILPPMSFMNFIAMGAQDPNVSIATGMTIYPEDAKFS